MKLSKWINLQIVISCLMVGFLTSGCRNNHQEKFQTQEIQDTEVPSITLLATETTMATLTPTVLLSRTPTLIVPTPTETPRSDSFKIPPNWIVYHNSDISKSEIHVVKMDGTGDRIILGGIGAVDCLAWSPDGEWIAFVTRPTYGVSPQIYLIRPDGSDKRRLTYLDGGKFAISWAPDNRSIVFQQRIHSRLSALYVYEFDIPRIRQLTDATNYMTDMRDTAPIYSPLGDSIAFVEISNGASSTFTSRLMTIDTDGGSRMQFMETSLHVYNTIDWSPDGKQIAFPGARSYKHCHNLYLFDIDAEEITPFVIDDYYHVWQPKWSPDGDWVSYIKASCDNNTVKFGSAQIYLKSIDTGEEIQTRVSLPNTSIQSDFDISPWEALKENGEYIITELGHNLRLRSTPSLSGETLKWLKQGEHIIVLDGPEEADEYLWWYVQIVESGKEGWVADNPGWYEAE